jgi:hypothetical protein
MVQDSNPYHRVFFRTWRWPADSGAPSSESSLAVRRVNGSTSDSLSQKPPTATPRITSPAPNRRTCDRSGGQGGR